MNKDKAPVFLSVLAVLIVAGAFATTKFFPVNPAENTAAVSLKTNDSSNIWADLKAKGLQGAHYTLNIHGKENFNRSDCAIEPDPITGQYSNNIFVPSNSDSSDGNQIIMMSGNVKGKWASTNPIYGVRDACTAPFDNDAAELILPPNEKGYYVTARVLGKPTNNPQLSIDGNLLWVQDEFGNDLLVLGLVTDNGFQTPDTTLTRIPGKVKAVDITGLFEWNGSVCYFSPQNYCFDDLGQYVCSDVQKCCYDSNSDGIYELCTDLLTTTDGITYCPTGATLLTLGCKEYVNEWVFNIGDFVGYMWDTYTSGDFKLANIRFYPVK